MLGHFGMIPLINHDSRVRENSEVVIICPDMCVCVCQVTLFWYLIIGERCKKPDAIYEMLLY